MCYRRSLGARRSPLPIHWPPLLIDWLANRRPPSLSRWLARQPTPACAILRRAKAGADDQNRTGDLVLTKDALCQLSYIGWFFRAPRSPREKTWSGRRGSNPRPTAWKAVTLPLSYSRLRNLVIGESGNRIIELFKLHRSQSLNQLLDYPMTRLPDRPFPWWWRGKDSNLRSR